MSKTKKFLSVAAAVLIEAPSVPVVTILLGMGIPMIPNSVCMERLRV